MYEQPLTEIEFMGCDGRLARFANAYATVELAVVSPGIVRLRSSNAAHPIPPHDNVVVDESFTMPLTIESKDPGSGLYTFTGPDVVIRAQIEGEMRTVAISLQDKTGRTVYSDLPIRSYSINGSGFCHYSKLEPEALHMGLGEKAAPLDLTKRTFSFYGMDALKYDAYKTDPLYKMNPFLITLPRGGGWALGEFSTSNSKGDCSIGSEIDGYWGAYRVLRQDHGGLEKYFMLGDSVHEVVRKYAYLVGIPSLPPRHWLGYLASSMGYAESDNPPAQERLLAFPELCKQHDIPCSAMHISSGYTVSMSHPLRRNVFTLNTNRFPDFKGMCEKYHRMGIELSANIKPYLSVDHPDYQMLNRQGALFKDPDTGGPVVTKVWTTVVATDNAQGSWVDLTSEAGQKWWTAGVKALLEQGIDVPWNDNNEYSLLRDDFLCGFENVKGGESRNQPIGLVGRMINTQMLAKCSRDACLEVSPKRRPFVITRSSNVGAQRYAICSWSGDNFTSWSGFKGNTIMILNAGMSLYHCYGNDVGGFAGPVTEQELLVRWVQVSIFNPRFSIHSSKPAAKGKGGITEPWMYEEALPLVRNAIKRRYELIPYLYSLHWDSHLMATPPNRWLGWGKYEHDLNVYNDEVLNCADFWCGDSLLIAGVFEPDATERRVYLPTGGGNNEYYYLLSEPYSVFQAGQFVTVPTPLGNIAVFAKSGTVVPIGKPIVTATTEKKQWIVEGSDSRVEFDDWRALEVFPPPLRAIDVTEDEVFHYLWIEDDGESLNPRATKIHVSVNVSQTAIEVLPTILDRGFEIMWTKLDIILPIGETRRVKHSARIEDRDGRSVWRLTKSFEKGSPV